jgi:glycosyltransferase involved in cell wall biosynthesis
MKIGIDASRAFVSQPTGTERYAYEMTTRMLRLPEAAKYEWILYTKRNISNKSQITKEIQIIKKRNPGLNVDVVEIGLPYLWTQIGLAYRTWVDGLDRLWVPAHTLPVLRKPGLVTVVTIHGIEYEWLPAYENLLQRWYLPLSTVYAVKHATRVIAVSKFTRDQLVERLKAMKAKIEVIGEGYELKTAGNEQVTSAHVMQEYGLRPKKYLLFVGTVQPRKNLVRLIQAYAKVSEKHQDLKLVICGKLGWNYSEVLEAVKKVDGGKIVITGYADVSKMEALLSASLLYVQPSITEGFGLPVLEAMDRGIPVASSNGGALPEVIGDAGVLFDPFSVEGMAIAIERILGDRELREGIVVAGKKQVKKFQWTISAGKVLKLLTYNI